MKLNNRIVKMKSFIIVSIALFSLLMLIDNEPIFAQDPLSLDYTFSETNIIDRSSVAIGVREIVDGVDQNSGVQYSASPPEEITVNVTAALSPDAQSVTFVLFDIDFIDTTRTINGSFSLGVSGNVPYTVNISDARITFPQFQAPLSADLRVLGSGVGEVTYIGTVDLLGKSLPFLVQGDASWPIDDSSQFVLIDQDVEFNLIGGGQVNNFSPEYKIASSLFDGRNIELRIASDLRLRLHRSSAAQPAPDSDNDGKVDIADNCPFNFNPDQADTDQDGVGDACNDQEDLDGDELANNLDNCPEEFNPDQNNSDGDAFGDACDPFPDDPNNEQAQCEADLEQALMDLEECQNACTPTHKKEKGPRCTDGIDNDCDGMMDSEDPDCQ